ncbi:MAG: 30S ribosomal protein S6 [Phycisphaerales bacterium JB038]
MTESRTAYYEGMFVFPQSQTADLRGAADHIKEVIARGEGELIAIQKWDERRLAYSIKNHNRGLYILTYFKAPTSALTGIERDCNLSEVMIRSLVTRAEHLTEEEMRAADRSQELESDATVRADDGTDETPAPVAAAPSAETAEAENTPAE